MSLTDQHAQLQDPSPLLLASRSPRRRELLEKANIPFRVLPAETEEKVDSTWQVPETPAKLAYQKAFFVRHLPSLPSYSAILAADTIVVLEGKMLGKPRNLLEARDMIWKLSRVAHSVITGVCLWPKHFSSPLIKSEETRITMQPITKEEIARYLQEENALDKAGGFCIEYFLSHVEQLDGPLDNVIGLPVALVKDLLGEANLQKVLTSSDRRGKK